MLARAPWVEKRHTNSESSASFVYVSPPKCSGTSCNAHWETCRAHGQELLLAAAQRRCRFSGSTLAISGWRETRRAGYQVCTKSLGRGWDLADDDFARALAGGGNPTDEVLWAAKRRRQRHQLH
eukprot:1574761-Rhodomonas_salina.1